MSPTSKRLIFYSCQYIIMYKSIVLLFMFSLFWGSILAQNNVKISLSEAVAKATRESNWQALAASQEEVSKLQWQETRTQQIPSLRVSGQYYYLSDARVSGLGIGSGSNANNGSSPQVSQLLLGQVSLNSPVFAGYRVKNQIEAASLRYQSQQSNTQFVKEQVALEVVNQFAELYKCQQLLAIINDDIKTARERIGDFENREVNGLVARNDLLKVKLALTKLELRQAEIDKNRLVVQHALNLLLKQDKKTVIDIDINQTQSERLQAPAIEKGSVRSDLLALELQESAAQKEVKVAQSVLYPTISLVGGYIAFNLKNVLEVTNAMNVGVGLSYDVSNWFKTPKSIQLAKAKSQVIHQEKEWHNEQIQQQQTEASLNYDYSLKRQKMVRESLKQAEENNEVVKDQFENGLATTTDLLEADAQLLEARIQVSLAAAEEAQRFYQQHFTQGTLLKSLSKK
ncbi:MAG: hypothetical protein CFE24_04615 [Flavobacterium sp. BFFFF2]|nr:MAG: hypothetical protein CFE24_04615 [Flavobacterium sp. BFFFF2]